MGCTGVSSNQVPLDRLQELPCDRSHSPRCGIEFGVKVRSAGRLQNVIYSDVEENDFRTKLWQKGKPILEIEEMTYRRLSVDARVAKFYL